MSRHRYRPDAGHLDLAVEGTIYGDGAGRSLLSQQAPQEAAHAVGPADMGPQQMMSIVVVRVAVRPARHKERP
ncbi:MAG: hypothetical protein KC461_03845, partial [Dehalococcoidia bacterium]|nr:hypothetical protein [Dehalococcoidia bacterium]